MYPSFEQKKKQIQKSFRATEGAVRLRKNTSNLFREREKTKQKIDMRDLTDVLHIDKKELWADVEGMITFEDFVETTLKEDLLPAVVPQLKSITVGGGVAGCAIESSSFKYGLLHENVLEMDILTGDGEIVTCSPRKNSDLFFSFPNSYGTLGYALRIRVKLYPCKEIVHLKHHAYDNSDAYFKALSKFCANKDFAFVDGVVFSDKEFVITTGTFIDDAPYLNDYTYMKIFYKSIKYREEDYLTTQDYIWRWDTDWFWCSKNLGVQHFLIRKMFGRKRLNSMTYHKIMRFNQKYKITRLFGKRKESVIQDVELPIDNANAFLDFFLKEVPILPVWICPTKQHNKKVKYPLYDFPANKLYINFGFWDTIPLKNKDHYYNKLIENKVEKLKGKKSLYSEAYYSRKKFWELYNEKSYKQVKKKYDPNNRLRDLYDKCVKRK